MRILIAYGTSEGQTRKIANRVAACVHELGHDAHLFDTASLEDTHVGSYDKVIVAGSVHQQRHQEWQVGATQLDRLRASQTGCDRKAV